MVTLSSTSPHKENGTPPLASTCTYYSILAPLFTYLVHIQCTPLRWLTRQNMRIAYRGRDIPVYFLYIVHDVHILCTICTCGCIHNDYRYVHKMTSYSDVQKAGIVHSPVTPHIMRHTIFTAHRATTTDECKQIKKSEKKKEFHRLSSIISSLCVNR